MKKKIQDSGNVVVKYTAVFLSIFLLGSVWIWTKTNRCFRCQGAWLWVIYSPVKKYSVCLCSNMHIHICWEVSKIGTWECRWLVSMKDSTNQERRKENTCWASAEGSHYISWKPSPLIFTQSLHGQQKLDSESGSETSRPQLLPKTTHTVILIFLRCCSLYCGDFPLWMFTHNYWELDFLWYC